MDYNRPKMIKGHSLINENMKTNFYHLVIKEILRNVLCISSIFINIIWWVRLRQHLASGCLKQNQAIKKKLGHTISNGKIVFVPKKNLRDRWKWVIEEKNGFIWMSLLVLTEKKVQRCFEKVAFSITSCNDTGNIYKT